MKRDIFDSIHNDFRNAFRSFVEKEIVPHHEQWEKDGIVDRELFLKAGRSGFLGMDVPEVYGGGGLKDFRFNAVISEELMRVGASGPGIPLHNDLAMPYFLNYTNEEQAERWFPKLVSGEYISAIAMTEPNAGSDLKGIQTTAVRQGDHYVVNGQKTFITNGILNDISITVVKTDSDAGHNGISLLAIERDMEGYTRGRNLEKIGQHAQDTAELIFQDVKVPVENLLGEEGQGFYYLMAQLPQERLTIAVAAVAAARTALEWTMRYAKERTAFGKPIGSFQNSRFKLAEMKTEIEIGQAFVDKCIIALNAGDLTAEEAAMAKWWTTEMQNRVVDACLQLHGGYGYMTEYPIARLWLDSRVQSIYGGTTEIMKEIVGRSLGF